MDYSRAVGFHARSIDPSFPPRWRPTRAPDAAPPQPFDNLPAQIELSAFDRLDRFEACEKLARLIELAARGETRAGVACVFCTGSSLSKLRVFLPILVVSPPRSRAKSAARHCAGVSPGAARSDERGLHRLGQSSAEAGRLGDVPPQRRRDGGRIADIGFVVRYGTGVPWPRASNR